MIKLRKCPFCGQEAVIVRHEYNGANDTFGIKCNWCKSQGNQFYETIDDAISMWNYRDYDSVKKANNDVSCQISEVIQCKNT